MSGECYTFAAANISCRLMNKKIVFVLMALGGQLLAGATPLKSLETEALSDSSKVVDLDEVVVVAQPKEQVRLRLQPVSSNVFGPANGQIPEGIEAQTEQVMRNIGAILEAAGLTYANVVKTTVLLQSIADFATMNGIYAKYFTADCPARAAFEVSALPKGALIEVEVIAAKN